MACGCNVSGQSGGTYTGPTFESGKQMSGGGGYDSPNFASGKQMGGGTRRRKRTRRHRRSGTRKAGSCGRKRACKCPGGCKRSTCPCCTGKRFCCTKRCRARGCRC